MDTRNSTATAPHPSTDSESGPCACYEGLVFVGHLVESEADGEEVEVVEAIPCRRCRPVRRA